MIITHMCLKRVFLLKSSLRLTDCTVMSVLSRMCSLVTFQANIAVEYFTADGTFADWFAVMFGIDVLGEGVFVVEYFVAFLRYKHAVRISISALVLG